MNLGRHGEKHANNKNHDISHLSISSIVLQGALISSRNRKDYLKMNAPL